MATICQKVRIFRGKQKENSLINVCSTHDRKAMLLRSYFSFRCLRDRWSFLKANLIVCAGVHAVSACYLQTFQLDNIVHLSNCRLSIYILIKKYRFPSGVANIPPEEAQVPLPKNCGRSVEKWNNN